MNENAPVKLPVEEIKAQHRDIVKVMEEVLPKMRQLGKLLDQTKRKVKKDGGSWEIWMHENLSDTMSQSTVCNYIRIHKRWDEIKAAVASGEISKPTQAYSMLRQKKAIKAVKDMNEFETQMVIHGRMTKIAKKGLVNSFHSMVRDGEYNEEMWVAFQTSPLAASNFYRFDELSRRIYDYLHEIRDVYPPALKSPFRDLEQSEINNLRDYQKEMVRRAKADDLTDYQKIIVLDAILMLPEYRKKPKSVPPELFPKDIEKYEEELSMLGLFKGRETTAQEFSDQRLHYNVWNQHKDEIADGFIQK